MTGTPAQAQLRDITWGWWLVVLVGVLSIVAGVIILFEPGSSLATLAVIAGIFLLVDGIYDVVVAIAERVEGRGLLAVIGVLSAIAGIILIRHPIESVVAIALLVGIWLVCIGVVRLISAFELAVNRGWNVFVALIEIAAGIIIVAVPDIGVSTLAIFIGIAFILRGLALCAAAWLLRAVKHDGGRSPSAVTP